MKQKYENTDLDLVAVQKKGFHGFPTMFHPHIEILCVLDGSIKVNVDASEHTIRRGEFCVVFPYVLHSYEDAPDAEFRLIMISPRYLPEFEKLLYSAKAADPFFQLDETLAFLTGKAVSSLHQDDPLGEKTACGYVTALMGEILSRSTLVNANSLKSTATKDLLIYCNEHFTEPISVKTAAAACFISESLVSKIFSREIGCSFRAYLNWLRIDYARRLLEKTDMKITNIMYASGFRNQTSFNRVFSDICGKTPRQYRGQFEDRKG